MSDPDISRAPRSGQPPSWDKIDRLVDAVQCLADNLNALAVALLDDQPWIPARPVPAMQSAAEPGADKETHAISCLLTIGPNLSAIAKRVGVSRTTLYRWPKFMEQLGKIQSAAESNKRRIPRGRKSKDGDVEAWE